MMVWLQLVLLLPYLPLLFAQGLFSDSGPSSQRRIELSGEDGGEQRRQVERLEYVMGVLKQKGLLNQVDPSLLSKVQQVIGDSKEVKPEGSTGPRDIFGASRQRAINSRHHGLALGQRATTTLEQSSSSSKPSSLNVREATEALLSQLGSNDDINFLLRGFPAINEEPASIKGGDECSAIRLENQALKQMLLKRSEERGAHDMTEAESHPHAVFAKSSSSPPASLTQQELIPGAPTGAGGGAHKGSALELLLQKKAEKKSGGVAPVHLVLGSQQEPAEDESTLRSVLVTVAPTQSTVFSTRSFETTVTVNVTKDIGIYYLGKRIKTEIVETQVKVQQTSEVLTTVTEITPTPTWSTFTVTPTYTPTPTPAIRLNRQEDEVPRNGANLLELYGAGRPQNLFPELYGGVRASVVEIPEKLDSFQSLQEVLRRLKEKKAKTAGSTALNDVTTVAPSETISIMTVFLSGSKPGEFTTSLSTVTLQPAAGRRRRSKDDNELNIGAAKSKRLPHVETTALPSWTLPLDAQNNNVISSSSVPQIEGSIASYGGDALVVAVTETVTVTITSYVTV